MCGRDKWARPIAGWTVIPAQSLTLHWRKTETCFRSGARDVLALTVTSVSHLFRTYFFALDKYIKYFRFILRIFAF